MLSITHYIGIILPHNGKRNSQIILHFSSLNIEFKFTIVSITKNY
jgi:hypothetical protein